MADCWARNLRIVIADSGPMVSGRFNTIQGVVYESARKADNTDGVGHHGL